MTMAGQEGGLPSDYTQNMELATMDRELYHHLTNKPMKKLNNVIEFLKYERARSLEDLKESQEAAGHSCYGAGVNHGEADMCDRILDFIKEED